MMSLGTGGGVLVIVAISALTTWANYVVVMFKLKHPEVYSMAGPSLASRVARSRPTDSLGVSMQTSAT